MENILNFLINIQILKKKKRRGWLIHQIKNSESTASHIFRMTMLSWILGKKKKLSIEKILKMALIHDLCEVFSFDETPYDPLLPKKINSPQAQKRITELLKKWPKLTLKQKREKVRRKIEREHQAFKKLLSDLPPDKREKIENLWLDFEKGISREARFVKQIDRAENFLQGMEYWKKYGKIQRDLWIRWAREIFDDPVLIKFEKAIEKRFSEKSKTEPKEEMDKILDFFIQIGKLKTILRKGPILIGAKNPETIADHAFRVAVMSWILGEERRANFNMERILKIALIHDICEVYIGDTTPYDGILPKAKKDWPELFDKWPRFSKTEKKKRALEKQKREKESLRKLTANLPQDLRNELKSFWLDYRRGSTREARFVKQVNRMETLLQALEYGKESRHRPFKSWWIGSVEQVDDPLLIRFMELLEKKFVPEMK
jgi:putative hydrolase of HD superfamily